MKKMVAPNGLEIRGTLEKAYGVAIFDSSGVTRDDNGMIHYEHGGETDMDWNSQVTIQRCKDSSGVKRDKAETVCVDEDGNEWLESQLVEWFEEPPFKVKQIVRCSTQAIGEDNTGVERTFVAGSLGTVEEIDQGRVHVSFATHEGHTIVNVFEGDELSELSAV